MRRKKVERQENRERRWRGRGGSRDEESRAIVERARVRRWLLLVLGASLVPVAGAGVSASTGAIWGGGGALVSAALFPSLAAVGALG